MTQPLDPKPASASKPEAKAEQPAATELSPEELDRATGGDKTKQTVQPHSISFTHPVDKASPNLF